MASLETFEEVRDGSGDPQGDLEWVGYPMGRSWMGRGNRLVVQNGSRTHGEVNGGLGDPSESLGRVKGPSRRFATGRGTLERSGSGRETLPEVQDVSGNLPEIWDGLGDPQGGEGRVG